MKGIKFIFVPALVSNLPFAKNGKIRPVDSPGAVYPDRNDFAEYGTAADNAPGCVIPEKIRKSKKENF